jgi:hypothetical protein
MLTQQEISLCNPCILAQDTGSTKCEQHGAPADPTYTAPTPWTLCARPSSSHGIQTSLHLCNYNIVTTQSAKTTLGTCWSQAQHSTARAHNPGAHTSTSTGSPWGSIDWEPGTAFETLGCLILHASQAARIPAPTPAACT